MTCGRNQTQRLHTVLRNFRKGKTTVTRRRQELSGNGGGVGKCVKGVQDVIKIFYSFTV